MTRATTGLLLFLFAIAAGCGGDDSAADNGVPETLVLLTHDSFAVSEGTLEEFTEVTGIEVRLLQGGDAGAVLNQAILTKDNPTADVLFGVDNTFLSRALGEGLFAPYESPLLDAVPDDIELDPDHGVTPIDYGDVCVNYDVAALESAGVPPPATLEDLADPAYRGMLVVQDPATSSPGLAFLLATVAEFGDEGDVTWRDFWADLATNDVLITSGWEEAYYGSFTAASDDGDRPLVVSYATSPPAEVLFAEPQPGEAPTASMTEGCFRQVEFAGVLAGTGNEEAARLLIDFMLSPTFQEDIPLNMFVFPANGEAELPEVFLEHAAVPEEPLGIEPDQIDANRERWIAEWTEIVR